MANENVSSNPSGSDVAAGVKERTEALLSYIRQNVEVVGSTATVTVSATNGVTPNDNTVFTITLNDVVEAPPDINVTPTSLEFPEDTPLGSTLATFIVTGKSDEGWTFVDNGQMNNLALNPITGQLSLVRAPFDYEQFQSLGIVVANGSLSRAFPLTITDVVESGSYDPSLIFSDERNSQYVGTLLGGI